MHSNTPLPSTTEPNGTRHSQDWICPKANHHAAVVVVESASDQDSIINDVYAGCKEILTSNLKAPSQRVFRQNPIDGINTNFFSLFLLFLCLNYCKSKKQKRKVSLKYSILKCTKVNAVQQEQSYVLSVCSSAAILHLNRLQTLSC